MEFDINTTHFYKICRTCLTMCENGLSICSHKIVHMITTCTSVQIWINDELPNQLCDNCFLQLQNLFQFKQLVEMSDMQLRKVLANNKQIGTEIKTAVEENIKNKENSNINDSIVRDCNKTSEFKGKSPENESSFITKDNFINESEKNDQKLGLKKSSKTKIKTRSNTKKKILSYQSRVSCEICKKQVTKQYLKYHLKLHSTNDSKQFLCEYCNKVLFSETLLDLHLINFHNDNWMLSKTSLIVDNKNKLTHGDELNQSALTVYEGKLEESDSNKRKTSLIVASNDENIVINYCQNQNEEIKKSSNNIKDTEGEIPVDREPCEVCGKLIIKLKRRRHMQIHSNNRRIFQCNKCDKALLSMQGLKLHFQTVHDKKYEFECKFCNKKFNRKLYCDRHEAVHRNDRPFQCSYCSKRFTAKVNLVIHIRGVHFKMYKKRFIRKQCTICGKLILENNMEIHFKTHKTERETFICSLCPNKKFLYKNSLDLHIKFKHENVNPEHLCTICGKRTKTLGELKIHMTTHNTEKTFICLTCGLKFKGRSGLQYHMKVIHSKLKSYLCSVCSRSFSTNTSLKRHMLIHTGERPFTCSLCERSFTQKSALKTHMKLIHSIENSIA